MGKAIVVGAVVVVVVLAVLVWLAFDAARRTKQEDKRAGLPVKGDLTARQEQRIVGLLNEAQHLLSGIGINDTAAAMQDPEIIRDSTRRAIGAWLDRFNTVRKGKS